MTPTEIIARLSRVTHSPTVTHLGGDSYRVVVAWDGSTADGRQFGAHAQDAIYTIDHTGMVTGVVILRYVLKGMEQDLKIANSYEFEEFQLNSYVGAVNFDAVFG